ncbi:MAG: multidrug transporter substrate-binding protein [Rickettsiaceae bacterium]|jgi:lipoprotein-releasing system permease protein|nr:multidrug transporter substrate-binding protein [Rickettsiaceae bacterium]
MSKNNIASSDASIANYSLQNTKSNMLYNSFILSVALRYFRAKKNEKLVSFISGFALLGVTLGVAALIVVMSVMNGFRIELTKNIIGLNSDIVVANTENNGIIQDYNGVIAKLKNEPYVKQVLATAVGQALATGPTNSSGVIVRGISLENLKLKPQVYENIISGSFDDLTGNNTAAVGSELALSLGLQLGDTIKLISPRTINTLLGSLPRAKDFKVVAVFSSQMYDYDAATVILPLEAAQNYYSMKGGVNNIEVYTDNPEVANNYARNLYFLFEGNFHVKSWLIANESFLNALKVERVAMFTILSLIIIVAVFNIISTLFMLVKDKTKDIAILRTIGASKSDIMLIFVINGFLSGLIGTILGILIGAGFAANINNIKKLLEHVSGVHIFDAAVYFLYNLPSKLLLSDVLFVSGISLCFSLLATLYPAYRAANLNPIEAMRYE